MSLRNMLAVFVVITAASGIFCTSAFAQDATVVAACDSKTHETPWYTLSPDGDFTITIESQTTVEPNPSGCQIQTTAWNRNHWTVTCWVTSSGYWQTSYRCHNWNTVWGDSWQASFMYMACPAAGCSTGTKEPELLSTIKRATEGKDTAPNHIK